MLFGGLGIYDEFFEVLIVVQFGVYVKLIVLVNVKGYFNVLDALVKDTVKMGFVVASALRLYQMADSAQAALQIIKDNQTRAPSR